MIKIINMLFFRKRRNPVVAFRNLLYDVKSNKKVDMSISSIHIDNFCHIVQVSIEQNGCVEILKITMEKAQEIGFININAISNYITSDNTLSVEITPQQP